MAPNGKTRREFLGGVGQGTLIGLSGCVDSWSTDSSASSVSHYLTKETFDEVDERFHDDGGLLGATNDTDDGGSSGNLGWGETYVLQAYLLMYRAHDDATYLDKFVQHADAVLENRDSVREVTDYRGRSLPAWRTDAPYTIGRVALSDDEGRALLEVRSAAANPDRATVTVSDGASTDTFRLVVRNPDGNRETVYDGLSMDPESRNYAIARINREGFKHEGPDGCLVTVKDLRDSNGDTGVPSTGTFHCDSPHYVYAVHTGMITYPLATYARLVRESERLQDDPDYSATARRYQRAVERAVRVHDHQWRETDDGRGFYVFEPGAPTIDESIDLPHNQSLALGRTLIQLAAVTEDDTFEEKAHKLARTFRDDLRTDDAGASTWSYHWAGGALARGWPIDEPESEYRPWAPGMGDPVSEVPEDISHGHIDVDFAVLAATNNETLGNRPSVFTDAEMDELARTFTENIVVEVDGMPAAREYVNGTGSPTGNHASKSALWTGLTRWNDQVFDHNRVLYDSRGSEFSVGAERLLGIASLNFWHQNRE